MIAEKEKSKQTSERDRQTQKTGCGTVCGDRKISDRGEQIYTRHTFGID